MKITEKINMNHEELIQNGPINIVAFGDSVTHGAVGPGEIDYESVFHNRLKKKINEKRNYMPVNVINAGIGGITAQGSLARMQAHVFDHHPDLVIICFGLNDVNGTLEEYLGALRTIFSACKEKDVDAIFMTPNMLNTYVAEDADPNFFDYAAVTAKMQNEGRMDLYMTSAVTLAKEMGITVCDCYSAWKKLSETEDITMLLANRINHPVREMHELFATMLFNTIFNTSDAVVATDSTMYKGQ